jgi:hypothetical protein
MADCDDGQDGRSNRRSTKRMRTCSKCGITAQLSWTSWNRAHGPGKCDAAAPEPDGGASRIQLPVHTYLAHINSRIGYYAGPQVYYLVDEASSVDQEQLQQLLGGGAAADAEAPANADPVGLPYFTLEDDSPSSQGADAIAAALRP